VRKLLDTLSYGVAKLRHITGRKPAGIRTENILYTTQENAMFNDLKMLVVMRPCI